MQLHSTSIAQQCSVCLRSVFSRKEALEGGDNVHTALHVDPLFGSTLTEVVLDADGNRADGTDAQVWLPTMDFMAVCREFHLLLKSMCLHMCVVHET
jgi:hypothetical protein